MGCHKYRSGYPRVRSHAKYSPPKQWRRIGEEITTMAANLAALMPAPSKAASISCRLATGVSTRPRLSCVRISPADNNDAVDVIASRLRHLHYLRQGVLRATLATLIDAATGTARQRDSKPWESSSSSHDPFFSCEAALSYSMVGMSRRRRPKFQPQSGVSARCNGGVAAQMGQRRPPARSLRLGERADPTL